MIPDRKLDAQEGLKSIRNGKYLSKYKIIFDLHFLKAHMIGLSKNYKLSCGLYNDYRGKT